MIRERLRWLRWWVLSLPARMIYRLAPSADYEAIRVAQQLRREGIVTLRFDDVWERGGGRFEQLVAAAQRLRQADGASVAAGKEYRTMLLPRLLTRVNPFVQLALEPKLIRIVRAYLGSARAPLRDLNVWWDQPTQDPAQGTQLWHRDYDDVMNVKVFVYLSHVTEQSGPFCFIPGSQPAGMRRKLRPPSDPAPRS